VLCDCLDVWDLDKCCVFLWMCGTQTSAVCFSGCVGLKQVLCVCFVYLLICTIHCICETRKSAVFFWMCGIQTRAVCFSGCVRLEQVLCVCLDVWDSDKCCVFVLLIYCICTIPWMCGTRTHSVCLSGCVGLRQVLCVPIRVPHIQKNTQHLSVSHTSRQTHSTCLLPTHPDKHTALVCVPHIQTKTQHLSESHTSRKTHSTCLSPTHPDKHTALV
jgi:hypothetical protein